MDAFASKGLRTLMFGMKELSENTTKKTLEDLPAEDYESHVNLLGVTGLEDLLQDNVKQCINEFRAAKIKVWMLTGDKGETAETIGISCGLIDDTKQQIFKIDSTNKTELAKILSNIQNEMRQ
jgi:phospholipid-transporting ATPase